MREPAAAGQLLLRPLRPPPPLLAGHLSRDSAPPRTLPPTLVGSAGQARCSRDRQVNVESAHIRAHGNRSDGVRTSTFPQGGASGAAPSLTPTRPTAFLRQCPAQSGRADSAAATSQDRPGTAVTRPRLSGQRGTQTGGGKLFGGLSSRHWGDLQAMRYPFRW